MKIDTTAMEQLARVLTNIADYYTPVALARVKSRLMVEFGIDEKTAGIAAGEICLVHCSVETACAVIRGGGIDSLIDRLPDESIGVLDYAVA